MKFSQKAMIRGTVPASRMLMRPIGRAVKKALGIPAWQAKALKQNIRKIEKAEEALIFASIRITAMRILKLAKALVPIDTTYLRDSGFYYYKSMVRSTRQAVSGGAGQNLTTKVKDTRNYFPDDNAVPEAKATVNAMAGKGPAAAVGFWSHYAIYVHELHPDKKYFLKQALIARSKDIPNLFRSFIVARKHLRGVDNNMQTGMPTE